jgi:hypothetical protein
MLVPHTFDAEKHLYLVPERFTLSTTTVLKLNGLGIPPAVIPNQTLDNAKMRGKQLDAAIQAYEEDRAIPEMGEEAYGCFMSYLRWKEDVGFRVCGPIQKSMVYQHEGTDFLVGMTPDIIGTIGNDSDSIWIVDTKACFRQSGKAQMQKAFDWRLQLQGYSEGLAQADELWETWGPRVIRKMVLHLNEECGIVKRGAPRTGYEQYVFPGDDSELWHAALVMAMAKLANGHKLPDREGENDEQD